MFRYILEMKVSLEKMISGPSSYIWIYYVLMLCVSHVYPAWQLTFISLSQTILNNGSLFSHVSYKIEQTNEYDVCYHFNGIKI